MENVLENGLEVLDGEVGWRMFWRMVWKFWMDKLDGRCFGEWFGIVLDGGVGWRILVGSLGWRSWMEIVVGSFGWKFWLEVFVWKFLVGKLWMEVPGRKFCLEVLYGVVVGHFGWRFCWKV